MMRDILLIIHFIGVALFVGAGIAFVVLEISNSKLPKEEKEIFNSRIIPLDKMGNIGLLILILSGSFLIHPYVNLIDNSPFILAKLISVVLLMINTILLILYSRKVKKNPIERYKKMVEIFGTASFFFGLVIVILAVLSFH